MLRAVIIIRGFLAIPKVLVMMADILDRMEAQIQNIYRKEEQIMAKYDALIAEVTENKDIVASTKAVLDKLVADLQAAKDDPAELQAIVDSLDAQNADLAAAVANVPAE